MLSKTVNIIFILLSIFICWESLKLGIGKFRNPGPGFLPFLVSIFFFSLSLLNFVQEIIISKDEGTKDRYTMNRKNLLKLAIIAIMLCGYLFSLNIFGYIIATYLLMSLLLVLFDPKKWYIYLIIAAVVVNLSFLFFGKWLRVDLPIGRFHIAW